MAEDMKEVDMNGDMSDDMMEDDDLQDEGSLFWSLKIPVGGDAVEISEPSIPGYIIHITNASFGADVKKGSRTVVTCTNYLQEEYAPVCVLKENQFETAKLDLLFGETAGFKLEGNKPSTVYLTGYLQPPMENDTNPSFDMDEMMARRAAGLDGLDDISDEDDDVNAPQLVDSEEALESSQERPSIDIDDLPANKKRKLNNKQAQKSPKQTQQSPKTQASPKQQQQQQNTKQSPKQSPKATQESPKSKKAKKPKKKLSGGIEYKDLKEGSGRKVKKGDTVYVYYIGQLAKDSSIFDKTLSGKGFAFKLGGGEVIKGWEIGLQGMKVGGKRKVWVPPKMGYGDEPVDKIPPNSQLLFTIEVKDIE